MNKRVTIVYPPQHVPGMPFLAPAMLKARLKAEGLESRVIDANIDFYHHALGTNEEVREAVATMHSDFPLSGLADYLDARLIIERTLDTFAQKF
ncbi:MAG: hypothetical protein HOB92_02650, partial [Candidatus Cloacimonetes bacterium]|nr:hypothetical protein [Candidatus Cloacimonadota bacterium]